MKNEDYIREKELANQPKAFDPDEMSNLIELIKTHICKIYCKDGSHGTGFFCYIPIGWGNFLTALMTNNHVLDENDIKLGETINFTINNDEKEYKISIDNNRETYTNESFDVTIIEIREEDEIDEKSFFDIDKQIFQENCINLIKNRQIFLLHYPKGIKKEISPGLIKNVIEDNGKKTIYHLCDTSGGSSGSPIINKSNFQVIGIHKGAPTKAHNYNLGTLLKEPIEEFTEKIKKKRKNNNKIYSKENKEKVEENKITENINNKKNIEENSEFNNNEENSEFNNNNEENSEFNNNNEGNNVFNNNEENNEFNNDDKNK